MKRGFVGCWVALAVAAVLLLAGNSIFAQQTSRPDKEIPLSELLRLPGRLVAEAKNAQPTKLLKLNGYRVEELKLPRTLTIELQGQQVVVATAWRVTVLGGPFPVRALPAVIWIDDQIAGYGIENETLSEITAITFDKTLIREGGVVSISYGEKKEGRESVVPRLRLLREGENQ